MEIAFNNMEIEYNNSIYYVSNFEIEVTSFHVDAGCLWKAPEDCYPPESDCEYRIIPNTIECEDENGNVSMAPFLADELSEKYHSDIETEIFENHGDEPEPEPDW